MAVVFQNVVVMTLCARPSQVRHERNLPYEDYLRRGAPAPHLAASFTQAHACPRSAHPSITSAKQLLTHVRGRGDCPMLAARAGAHPVYE